MNLWVRKTSAEWFTSDARGELGPEVILLHDFVTCRFGPLVLLGFSLSTQHLILQDSSEWYRLIARWSWSRWATFTVIEFPQSIQFKPPRQKHQVWLMLSLLTQFQKSYNITLSHPIVKQVTKVSPDSRGEDLSLSGNSCQEFAAVLNPWYGLIYRWRNIFISLQWQHK